MSCIANLWIWVLNALSYFFTISPCRMHWSTCCSNACVSTPDSMGHSWPPPAVENVYREFAVDHGTCHAFVYAYTQIICTPSNSLCDRSMRPAENRTVPNPFCAKSSAESSGVSGWLLIRFRFFTYYLACGAHINLSRHGAPVTSG